MYIHSMYTTHAKYMWEKLDHAFELSIIDEYRKSFGMIIDDMLWILASRASFFNAMCLVSTVIHLIIN